jgi:hypothetical protein
VETLVDGCVQGTFVLKLTRPDRTFRTWWRSRPDDAALHDPAMELVLPDSAELGDIAADLLAPKMLPDLWASDEITTQSVLDYFDGTKIVQVDKGGFTEAVPVPRATADVVYAGLNDAVEAGKVWLLSGPASLLAEPIPAGVLSPSARLRVPPSMISAASILPENLPDAWEDGFTTPLSIATTLSQKQGRTLPWKTVRDVIGGAISARFVTLADHSAPWPCDFAGATAVKLVAAAAGSAGSAAGGTAAGERGGAASGTGPRPGVRVAEGVFEPSLIQDLGDMIPALLDIKAKAKVPMNFRVVLELGDGTTPATEAAVSEVNRVLKDLDDGFQVI